MVLPSSWRTRVIPKVIVWDKCGSYGKWHLRLKIPKVNISREFSKRSWVKKLKVKEECSLKSGAIVLPVCCKEEKWCGTASVSRVAPNVAHSSTRLACSCGQGGTASIRRVETNVAHSSTRLACSNGQDGTASIRRVSPNVAHSSTRLACSCGQGSTASLSLSDHEC